MNRLEELKLMLKENPKDPFFTYAVLLEELKNNENDLISELKNFLATFPQYLPGWQKLIILLIQNGKEEDALQVLPQAVDLASAQNEIKAYNELRAIKTNLELEGY